MKPVIKNYREHSNPILGKSDGVPNYVMLYVQHAPGESSPFHTHPWEHQAFITEGSGVLFFGGEEYPINRVIVFMCRRMLSISSETQGMPR